MYGKVIQLTMEAGVVMAGHGRGSGRVEDKAVSVMVVISHTSLSQILNYRLSP